VLYRKGREIGYVIYESSSFEIQGSIAQDTVTGMSLERQKQLM
jgi:hypothetical protein